MTIPSAPSARFAPATLCAVVLLPLAAALAQPDPGFWSFPRGSVAWVAADAPVFRTPAGPDPLGTLIDAGVDASAFALTPWAPSSIDVPRALLDGLTAGPWPWRACLIAIEAAPAPLPPGDRVALRPTRIAAVIEVRAPAAEHEQLRGSVRGVLGVDAAADLARVDIAPPPGGNPVAWSPLTCRSDGDAFIVTLGEGAAERWAAARDAAPWDRHRTAMGDARGRPVLAAFADLNALRRAMPDAFGATPLRRALRAFALANAREAMVRARLVEAEAVTLVAPRSEQGVAGRYAGAPLLAIDASWSPRTEPPGTVRALAVTGAQWPGSIPGLEPRPAPADAGGARYAIAAPAAWGRWASVVVNTWVGAGDDWDELNRATKLGRWQRLHADALTRVVRASGAWAVAWAPVDQPAIFAAVPTAADARILADHRVIFGSIDDAIAFDAPTRAWAVGFRAPALRLRWTCAGEGPSRAMVAELRPQP